MGNIEKLPLTSLDIKEQQLLKLKELFPEVFTEGLKVDWDKLKLTLGEDIDSGKERFGMNWPGKADCFKTIQQPSIATLVPAREESIDFDITQNLFIEGDNLEVLKLLQKSYLSKIKMIYIDPPYNTGNEFIYPDNYSETLETYLEYTGQTDSEGRKFSTNTDTDGRFHSKWLNMMYPRLFLAKNLLREDGVIFISIDDNELHNLKGLCNEIYGEENYRGLVSRATGTRMGSGNLKISSELDYILIYSKSEIFDFYGLPMADSDLSIYDQEDERGKYLIRSLRRTGGENRREDRPTMYYGVKAPDDTEIFPIAPEGWESRWICSKEKYQELVKEGFIVWKKVKKDGDEKWQVYQKHYLGEGVKQASNNWSDIEGNKKATRDLNSLFEGKKLFDHPKPIGLLKKIIGMSTSNLESDIVLDFFAGSATTAHSLLELNKEDEGNRKFICIQLPEPTDNTSEAFKAGYRTIADISKERIRRVIQNIKQPQTPTVKDKNQQTLTLGLDLSSGAIGSAFTTTGEDSGQLDLGFKVFKLQKSNFHIWDASIEKTPEAVQTALFNHVNHISPEAEQEAILFELLVKSGFELATPIEKRSMEGKTVFSIAEGELLVCLEKQLSNEVIKAMAERQPTRVICLDEGFQSNDQLKTNAVQIMKSKGVVNFRTV